MKSPKFQVVTEFHWMSVDVFGSGSGAEIGKALASVCLSFAK